MSEQHALLSPSKAARWLFCTPSARLEETLPDSVSEFAEEGRLAHAVGENILKKLVGQIDEKEYKKTRREHIKNKFFSKELEDYAKGYAEYVFENFLQAHAIAPDTMLEIEEKINLSMYAPDCSGTADAVIITNKRLAVIDFKYGKGVPVSAENNAQMLLYALGAYEAFGFMYDIQFVSMAIYQPRLNNVSICKVEVPKLLKWAETELRPQAKKAFAGEGDFVAGSHCRFCKAKHRCKTFAKYNLSVEKFERAEPEFLSDKEIAEILAAAGDLKNWLSSIEEYALSEALKGTAFPGFKLVAGRSKRIVTDADRLGKILLENGFTPDQIFDPAALKPLSRLEENVTKKKLTELAGELILKHAGKPALVSESDPRPAFSSAENDFKNVDI